MPTLGKNIYTQHKDLVILDFNFVIGATGAVGTLKGTGIKSVVRTDVGQYAITLNEAFNRMIWSASGMLCATNSGIMSIEIIDLDLQDKIKAGTAYTIQMYDKAGAAADATNPSVCSCMLVMRRSEVPDGGMS